MNWLVCWLMASIGCLIGFLLAALFNINKHPHKNTSIKYLRNVIARFLYNERIDEIESILYKDNKIIDDGILIPKEKVDILSQRQITPFEQLTLEEQQYYNELADFIIDLVKDTMKCQLKEKNHDAN